MVDIYYKAAWPDWFRALLNKLHDTDKQTWSDFLLLDPDPTINEHKQNTIIAMVGEVMRKSHLGGLTLEQHLLAELSRGIQKFFPSEKKYE